MSATGGGRGGVYISEMEERIRAIVRDVALSGISTDVHLNTDVHPQFEDAAKTPDGNGMI